MKIALPDGRRLWPPGFGPTSARKTGPDLARRDLSWRCATPEGAGLPSHLVPSEWELLHAGASPVSDHAEEDIEEFGFCLYRLVGLQ